MIEPYYEQDNIRIFLGDCRDVLPQFADKSFDLVLTDPPYGMNKGGWDKKPEYSFLGEARRVLKDDTAIYVFCGDNSYMEARFQLEKHFKFGGTLIWERENFYGNNDWHICHEYILYGKCGKPPVTPTRQNTSNASKQDGKELGHGKSVLRVPGFNSVAERLGHPTTKPKGLCIKFILASSQHGDSILDPFGGSGTTAVAAKQLGRKCTLIEIEEKYCEIAVKRLAQMELFAPKVTP